MHVAVQANSGAFANAFTGRWPAAETYEMKTTENTVTETGPHWTSSSAQRVVSRRVGT